MSSTKFVFFRVDQKNKMAALASETADKIQRNLTGSKILMSSAKLCFSGRLEWQLWYLIIILET